MCIRDRPSTKIVIVRFYDSKHCTVYTCLIVYTYRTITGTIFVTLSHFVNIILRCAVAEIWLRFVMCVVYTFLGLLSALMKNRDFHLPSRCTSMSIACLMVSLSMICHASGCASIIRHATDRCAGLFSIL